jgi:Xaa-Pro aminopeptidase
MNKRIANVVEAIKNNDQPIDGLLVVRNERIDCGNARYISGFSGSTAVIVISPERQVILVDLRYTEQAEEECPDFEVLNLHEVRLDTLVKEMGIKRLGYEPSEMTVNMFERYKSTLSDIELVPTRGIIQHLRAFKDEKEIEIIARACKYADEAFSHYLTCIKPGITEKKLAFELEMAMRRAGADRLGFDLILVSGKRSSHQHGAPTDKVLEVGDFVTLDFGAETEGYRCDITRTIVVGEASEKQREIYEAVRLAQQTALDMCLPGAQGPDIAAAARKILVDSGYGEWGTHGIGHGVGLEIHEAPGIGARNEIELKPGHVFTVEPGIYIPDFGGVRIEDTVAITEDGQIVLSKSPKELLIL